MSIQTGQKKKLSIEIAACFCFFSVFLFTQSIGTIIRINTSSGKELPVLESSLLLFPASILLSIGLTTFLTKQGSFPFQRQKRQIEIKKRNGNSSFFLIWCALLLFWLPYFLAYYPGIFAYDAVQQWTQFFHEDVALTTHHPLLHTLLFGGTIWLGRDVLGLSYEVSAAICCLTQLVLLAAVTAYVLFQWRRRGCSGKMTGILFFWYALLPLFPILGISVTKDVYFSVFFLWSFEELTASFLGEEKMEKATAVKLFLAMTGMQLFRNNAKWGLLLFLGGILVVWIERKIRKRKSNLILKRIFYITVLSVLAAELLTRGLMEATKAESVSMKEMLSVPCQQLARTYCEQEETMSAKDKEELYRYMPAEVLKGYDWQLADYTKNLLNIELVEEKPMEFIRLWLRIGLQYPKEYVEAFLYNTLPLWYIGDVSIEAVNSTYLETDSRLLEIERQSKFWRLMHVSEIWIKSGKVVEIPVISLLFRPSFYLWMILAGAFFLWGKQKGRLLWLPFYVLCYAATLLFGPCILPRYCLNIMLCVPALLPYCREAAAGREPSTKQITEAAA